MRMIDDYNRDSNPAEIERYAKFSKKELGETLVNHKNSLRSK